MRLEMLVKCTDREEDPVFGIFPKEREQETKMLEMKER